MKVAAVVQALILILLGLIVLIKSGVMLSQFYEHSLIAIWIVVAFFLLSTVLNSITPSKKERNIWAPVSFLLLITSLIIAAS